jgi:hypothetical protein
VAKRLRLTWLAAIRSYLFIVVCGNAVWELAQLPLYTLWHEGTAVSIAYAWLHCTVGDAIIASVSLIAALAIVGRPGWPDESYLRVAVAVLILGMAYTMFSEYINTIIRRSWSYAEWMPTLPWIGTGLAPLAQWIAVPVLALIASNRIRSKWAG